MVVILQSQMAHWKQIASCILIQPTMKCFSNIIMLYALNLLFNYRISSWYFIAIVPTSVWCEVTLHCIYIFTAGKGLSGNNQYD